MGGVSLYERACEGKVIYFTHREAMEGASRLFDATGEVTYPYLCPF